MFSYGPLEVSGGSTGCQMNRSQGCNCSQFPKHLMTLSIRIIDIADNHLSDLIGKHRYRATGLLDATRNRLQMTIIFANVVMSVCFLLGWWFHFRIINHDYRNYLSCKSALPSCRAKCTYSPGVWYVARIGGPGPSAAQEHVTYPPPSGHADCFPTIDLSPIPPPSKHLAYPHSIDSPQLRPHQRCRPGHQHAQTSPCSACSDRMALGRHRRRHGAMREQA